MKKFYSIAILALSALVGLSSCAKDDDVFQRDTDAIEVDCNAQSVTHYVLANGAWSLETDEDWISFNPSEGTGDGIKFQSYEVVIAYNRGERREGVYYLVHNGAKASVIVTQGPCSFKYGKASFEGTLTKGEASTATVLVAYTGAAGDESVSYSGTVSGAGAAGLSIENGKFESFTAGSGSVVIPVSGTPEATGEITIAVSLDGVAMGTVTATVEAPAAAVTTTTLAKWTFAEASDDNKKAELTAAYPSWINDHYIDAMDGKGRLSIYEPAGKTLAAVTGCSFANGHLYFKGMQENDAVLFTIPATLSASATVQFSGCMGGAGSSAAYYLAEYSTDGTNWTEAPGAQSASFYGMNFKYHCKVEDNITDVLTGTFNTTFTPGAVSGTLYVRLRVPANLRMNHTSTTYAINTSPASSRFKGNLSIVATDGGGAQGGALSGIPVGWNFYALGLDGPGAVASEYAKHWVKDTSLPEYYVPATSGNSSAVFTAEAVVGTVTNHNFNPSIQCQGFLEGDYWLATIPVTGLTSAVKLKIEAGCGSAGGSVGYYIMEYSTDKATWTEVPGAKSQTRGEDTFTAHLWNTGSSISAAGYTNTRKSYDKATDDTYQVYTMTAPDIESGNLYIRLRVLKYRATPGSTQDVAAGWTDIKGFEISIAE